MPLPDVHYGEANDNPLDWRKYKDDGDETDNDQDPGPASQSVIDMLGFNPDELFDDEAEEK